MNNNIKTTYKIWDIWVYLKCWQIDGNTMQITDFILWFVLKPLSPKSFVLSILFIYFFAYLFVSLFSITVFLCCSNFFLH